MKQSVIKSTYSYIFNEKYPQRYFNMGIAEIGTVASAAGMAAHADGVVVGSALVAALAAAADPADAARGFLAPLRAALDAGGPAGPLR